MERYLSLFLSQVPQVPNSLRDIPTQNVARTQIDVHLGQLYQHYYFDCFPTAAPPCPDPSRFEYLQYLARTPDFRFLAQVQEASVTKKRGISTDLGQAFCRWALDTHFGIRYFAHMSSVLDKFTHPAFGGLRIRRAAAGDVPDYLCARRVDQPLIAEAKGRFSAIGFNRSEFKAWRSQFSRIRVLSESGALLKAKGYIVATRLVTESNERTSPGMYIEDPETEGDSPLEQHDNSSALGRLVVALHYGRVLRKLDLSTLAAAIENGGSMSPQLFLRVPIWRCISPPFQGQEFVGGIYQTTDGVLPRLTDTGWEMSLMLGRGHGTFVGLGRSIAETLSRAARGELLALDDLPEARPEGVWSSEFSWLRDGTVVAPMQYFLPTGVAQL